jgi:hypothetical protein
MSQKSAKPPSTSERLVRDIRRATRKQYAAEEKIRIVLDYWLARRCGTLKATAHRAAPTVPYGGERGGGGWRR